jgi:hypothetical protein
MKSQVIGHPLHAAMRKPKDVTKNVYNVFKDGTKIIHEIEWDKKELEYYISENPDVQIICVS